MDVEKAIELLSDYCDRGCASLGYDFKEAVRMGKKALILFATTKGYRLDDLSLKLLLNAERRENGR